MALSQLERNSSQEGAAEKELSVIRNEETGELTLEKLRVLTVEEGMKLVDTGSVVLTNCVNVAMYTPQIKAVISPQPKAGLWT